MIPDNHTPSLLTTAQTAARLSVSTRTVQRMIQRHRIAVVPIGRCVRITEAAIERFVRERTINAREI